MRKFWEVSITIYLEYLIEVGPLLSTRDRFLLLSFLMKDVILLRVLRVLLGFLGLFSGSSSQVQELRMLMS